MAQVKARAEGQIIAARGCGCTWIWCGSSARGLHIKRPGETPREEEQENLTDPDSRLVRKSKRSVYEHACNAQTAVDADGSQTKC